MTEKTRIKWVKMRLGRDEGMGWNFMSDRVTFLFLLFIIFGAWGNFMVFMKIKLK